MPLFGDWVRVDGTSWWRDRCLFHLPTPQIPLPLGLPLPSQGNALFNIQLDSQHSSHLGVVLGGSRVLSKEDGTNPLGVLGLMAATMGNGVCKMVPIPTTGNGVVNSPSDRGRSNLHTH